MKKLLLLARGFILAGMVLFSLSPGVSADVIALGPDEMIDLTYQGTNGSVVVRDTNLTKTRTVVDYNTLPLIQSAILSPDRTKVYVVARNTNNQNLVYRVNVDGSGLTNLGYILQFPNLLRQTSISPDGTRLAVTELNHKYTNPKDGAQHTQISILNIETGQILTELRPGPGDVRDATWASNDNVLFTYLNGLPNTYDACDYSIAQIKTDGTGFRLLTPDRSSIPGAGCPMPEMAIISPDGQKIMYDEKKSVPTGWSIEDKRPAYVYVMNLDGTNPQLIYKEDSYVTANGYEINPSVFPLSWASDQSSILYYSTKSNTTKILDLTTGQSTKSMPAAGYGYNYAPLISWGGYSLLSLTNISLHVSDAATNSPNLSWGATTGADRYNIYRDTQLLTNIASLSYLDTTALEGQHQYFVRAIDGAVQGPPSNTVNVLVDKTSPVISYSLSSMPNAEGWNKENVTVTFSCVDVLTEIVNCTAPQTITQEGVTTVNAVAVDKAGNQATLSVEIKIDKIAPVITFTAISDGWVNTQDELTYQCVDQLGSPVIKTAPIITNPDGTKSATGTCTDAAGNTTSQTVPVYVDSTAPQTNYSYSGSTSNPLGWSTGPVTVTFECSDPGDATSASGIEFCSEPVTVSQEGTTVVTGIARDKAGNVTEVNVFVNIDSTPPTIAANYSTQPNSAGWYSDGVTVSFVCADSTSGVVSCPVAVTYNVDGTYTETKTVTDVAGNTASVTYTVQVDKTNPTIDFSVSPLANIYGWNNSTVVVTFICDDATSGVATCTDPVMVDTDGISAVTGYVTDIAGNTNAITAFVSVDATKPTISTNFTSATPTTNGWYTNDVNTSFACDDAVSGIQSCNSSLPTITADGIYDVTGTATDFADNVTTLTSTVKLDKTAPVMAIPAWTSNPLALGSSATVSIPTVDGTSGLTYAEYYVGDTDPGLGNATAMTMASPWVDANGSITSANFGASFGSNLATGIYKVTIRAHDTAGNWTAPTVDYLVVFDAAGPTDVAVQKRLFPDAVTDVLPGLTVASTGQATLAFDVTYTATGTVSAISDLKLDYANNHGCNANGNGTLKAGCELTTFTASTINPESIDWLTFTGTNGSLATFQGTGTLSVTTPSGVLRTANPYRVIARDGNLTSPTSTSTATLYVFATGSDVNAVGNGAALYHLTVTIKGGKAIIQ